MRKLFYALAALAVISLLFGSFACAGGPAAPSKGQFKVRYGTSSIGGPAYLTGVTWTEMMNRYVKSATVTAEVTAGSTVNVQLMEKGEQDIGIGSSVGEYQFIDQKNVRSLWVFWPIMFQPLVLADSGMKTLYDWEGKTVSTGPATIPATWLAEQTLEILGINAEFKYMSAGETGTKLLDGIIDAIPVTTGYPWSVIVKLESAKEIRFMEMSDADIQKMMDKYVFFAPNVIPAGTYKALKEDYKTFGCWQTQDCRVGMPEDVIYEITKNTLERWSELEAVAPIVGLTHPLEDVKYCVYPLHPGAVKAYRELGASIPDRLIPPEMR